MGESRERAGVFSRENGVGCEGLGQLRGNSSIMVVCFMTGPVLLSDTDCGHAKESNKNQE